jgi:hypothetical protein
LRFLGDRVEKRSECFDGSKADLLAVSVIIRERVASAYIDAGVLEALSKDFLDCTFVLLLYYAGSCRKDSESTLTHARIARLAGLE